MADLIFQGISSDSNRAARIWQRPMRSPTSHARIAIFSAESPILAKTMAEEIGKIADRDIPFAKMLELVQHACSQISDGEVGLLIGESDNDTLIFHAHGPIRCYLAESTGNGSFGITPLPVETYSPTEPFSYVTGQVGSGVFVACTADTEMLAAPETIAAATLSEDGLWQLKQQLEEVAESPFCLVIGKTGALSVASATTAMMEAETPAEAFTAAAEVTQAGAVEDLFAPAAAVQDAVEGVQNWAKDTRTQFKQSMNKATTFDPGAFFRKLGGAFAAGKSKGGAIEEGGTRTQGARMKNFWRNVTNRFLDLPRNLQIASSLFAACIIIFLIGLAVAPVFGYGRGNNKADQELIAISSMLDDAQSNLIYKNEARAVTLVKEADGKLQSLTADKPLFKNKDITRRENELASRIMTMRADLRHAVSINAADRVMTPNSGITMIGAIGKELFAARNNELLRWNSTETLFESLYTAPKAITALVFDDIDNQVVMRLNDDSLVTYDAKSKKTSLGPTMPVTATAIAAYGGRLYAIDGGRGVIRITATGVNAWLKTPTPIANGKALAVDGDVYAATTAEIKKFRTGSPINFSLGTIDPLPGNISTVFTIADSSYLYILDQNGARILVVNKNGGLIKQYELNGATAKGMAISEASKTAHILTENQILAIPLSHL